MPLGAVLQARVPQGPLGCLMGAHKHVKQRQRPGIALVEETETGALARSLGLVHSS